MNDDEFNNRPWGVEVYSEEYTRLSGAKPRRVIHRRGHRYIRDNSEHARKPDENPQSYQKGNGRC